MIADEKIAAGGSLLHRDQLARIDGKPVSEWIGTTVERLKALGVVMLTDTTAFGIYDHTVVGLNQRQKPLGVTIQKEIRIGIRNNGQG